MQARLVDTAAEKVEADALLLPIFEGQTAVPKEAVALDKKLKGAVEQLLKDREFRGKFMELAPIHNLSTLPSRWTVLVGIGKVDQLDMVRLRNALQAAGRTLRRRGHRRLAVVLPKEVAARAGAAEPARMIVLRYSVGRKGSPTLALVGKGITFDSGGISIKPSLNMEKMKSDMGGGAAVVGAMLAIAELKPRIIFSNIAATTENM